MQKILLTKGKVALVDDDDYLELSKFRWYYHSAGYATLSSGRELMHRMIMKAPSGVEVDHINMNKLDNRRCNLRLANRSENMRNANSHRDNKSGFRGVSWFKRDSKWRVQISVNGKNTHVGYFESKNDAANAYNMMAIKHFGKFALLNEV